MKFTFFRNRCGLYLISFILINSISAQITDPNQDVLNPEANSVPLNDPFEYDVYYDAESGNYLIYRKIGNYHVGTPMVMTPEEFSDYTLQKSMDEYYREKSNETVELKRADDDDNKPKSFAVNVPNKIFESVFGGGKIELIPQGYLSFDLGILNQKIDNPQILPQNRKNFTIDIQQRIQLSLLGKVGNNLQLQANYDTQSGFAFENKMNLAWRPPELGMPNAPIGGDDHIIKNIEFGNVSMPLSTNLIQGPQALFGIKTELQFGRTYITSVFSDQRSEARQIAVQGGGLVNTFKISALDYEDNQHYFLGQFFRNHYDQTLLNYPFLNTNINITRIEVWKIDIGNGNLQEQRTLLGLRDLGEDNNAPNTSPDNSLNNIYGSVANLAGIDNPETAYAAINNQQLPDASGNLIPYNSSENFAYTTKAKLLSPSEFKLNPQLGFISLSQRLTDDQLLAVSYEYTINGSSETYKVGTFSNESSNVLKVKLIKHNATYSVQSPMWDLMMKNVYNLNGSQISRENFFLNVTYKDPGNGNLTYIPDPAVSDKQLIKVVNWDRLNLNGDNTNGLGDGIFDFVEGITIEANQGRVYFTKVEPFGNNLTNLGVSSDYVYNDLYDKQKTEAISSPLATRYNLEGRYQGAAGVGIPLGAINVPRGSVTVTSNGQELTEGIDYTVDYQLGRVQIINQALKDSGAPINISLENQSTFNLQRKRFIGLNVDHVFNEHLEAGFTAVNYQERPVTQKAQYGVEPVKNTVLGANIRYNNTSEFLTRLADGLPMVKTNAPSNINFTAEGAYLIPGVNKAVQNQSYIDDFDQAATRISLKDPNSWMLASVPNSNDITPFGLAQDQTSGYLRSLVSWYNIDPRFYGVGGSLPNGVNNSSLSQNMVRRVEVQEIYENRDLIAGQQTYMNTFDITIYPEYKGPYNNDNSPIYSDNDFDREQRWGGVMSNIRVTNFQQANIETLEFWVMDPYADLQAGENLGSNPELYIQLGNISEDVLRDGKLQYENGLPTETNDAPINNTPDWGVYPNNPPVLYSFDTEGDQRRYQDAGFDGILSNDFPLLNTFNQTENNVFSNNLGNNPISALTNKEDPALDDFYYYYSEGWDALPQDAPDIRQRYRYFRNPEGNSPSGSLESSSALPDAEDVNKDYNLDLTENYNQYQISLKKSDLENNSSGYIVDEKSVDVSFENGATSTTKWYLFRVPLDQYQTGSEEVLNNVRFMRLLMKGFNKTSTLRFGTLDLLGNTWRKYDRNIYPEDDNVGEGNEYVNINNVEVGSVDIESNGAGAPPYVLPPGIIREELGGTTGVQSQNEASLYLKILKLSQNEARGLFKNINLDMRRYKEMRFFVHAEDIINPSSSELDEDAKFFIRIGSDLNENYYEYEFPLKYTPNTATSVTDIWPNENNISVNTDWFTDAKKQRDQIDNTNIDYRYDGFDTGDPLKKVIVKGRPSMGNVTTIMIGARNETEIQGDSKNLILWVNELRLYGMDNEGGYAANASINFNLGDFATVNASGNYSSIGYGAIDAGPSLRNQDETRQYVVSTQVNVDKMLPEKWGVKIPFQYSVSETFVDPKYDPLDNDIEIKESPRKDEIQKVVRTYTNQKTYAVTNMRKERTSNRKPKFYDVENLTTSFLYSDDYFRDIYTRYNYKQNLRAALDYNYTFKSKGIEPFKNAGFVQDTAKTAPYFQWVKQFNINLVPSRFNFKTELIRSYNEFQFRDINAVLFNLENNFPISYANNFVFGWQYNVGFNLSKSLKLDINSATRTLVDDIGQNGPDDKMIWNDLVRVGRPINYNHNVGLNYRLPFQYFPFIDFLSGELAYTGNYTWMASSTALDIENQDQGNLAQNGNTKNATGSINFNTLYNKFGGYKKYDSIRVARNRESDSLSRVYEANASKKKKKNFKKYKFKHKYRGQDYVWGFLSMFKQAQISYSENNSTALPGFLPHPGFWGYGNTANGNYLAPTFGFLTGDQKDLRQKAYNENWLSTSNALFQPYMRVNSETLNMSINIQPIKNLNVDLNFLRNNQRSYSQVGYNLDINAFQNETASFNSSIISTKTAFNSQDDLYNKLLEDSRVMSQRVATANGSPNIDLDNDGYVDGYGLTNSAVLIPSFYSAFTGKSANSTKLGYKKGFPSPNWRITYTGLNSIPFINYWTKNIELSHGYISTYSVNGVQSSLDYYAEPGTLDLNNNYKNYYNYNTVNITEAFSPLIGVDMTFRNDMQFSFDYDKDRMSILSLNNYTMQEDFSKQYNFTFGYIIRDLTMKMRINGKSKKMKSDLNIRAGVSIRDTKTTIRRLIENDLQITGGQKLVSIQFSADYDFSKSLNVSLFYDQQVSSYKISTAYPLSITRAGLRVTFNFGR